jgi:SAM-dependent methyltransferase
LDVGCGNGEFLALAVAAGYAARGIDVSPTSSVICQQKGLSAVSGDFLSHDFGAAFDVVTMWDVMEHLRLPGEFVARAHSLLAPDGVLLLKIPSKGELNFSLLRWAPRRGGTLLGAPNHVQFFSERSLARLVARCGFTQILWFEHQRFRTRPPTLNPRKLVARSLSRLVAAAAFDRNLYALVAKQSFPQQVLEAVRHRRIERLEYGPRAPG